MADELCAVAVTSLPAYLVLSGRERNVDGIDEQVASPVRTRRAVRRRAHAERPGAHHVIDQRHLGLEYWLSRLLTISRGVARELD
jgi:hypothetical protein